MKKTAIKAFAPAGISSFFEICDTKEDGKPITDLTKVGARGGGFVLKKGVLTEVTVSESENSNIEISINGKPAPEAETTKNVVQTILKIADKPFEVNISHKIEIPIGAGFGTSAGGALTTGLALSKALDLHLTYNQIGKIAHVAEVQCKTGLGTVGPIMLGGCILTLEPGAPGISVIDRLPLNPDYVIITGVFGPTPTKKLLASIEKRLEINRWGKKTLEQIIADPCLENFLESCWEFSQKTGFATENTRQLAKLALDAGAVGAAQNMVGEAVHAVACKENCIQVAEAFKKVLPKESVIVSEIDFQGARLVRNEEIQESSSRRNL